MTEVVDLSARRFAAAKDASETSVADALREALRRVESGSLTASSIVITYLIEEDDNSDSVESIHGGSASCNERIGMLYRAQMMLLPSNLGGNQ